ncbi:acyltransferase family protein [Burkholderia cepacia]|nr:acyltransferase [Burkholderia cepacia]
MRQNLEALTTLRFFAAAGIVIYHTSSYFEYGTHLQQVFPIGLGVSFFFVLSGFVLYYAYPELLSGRDRVRFIAARIAKVWPLHAATMFLTIAFLPYPWGIGPLDSAAPPPLLINLFLLQSWIPLPHYFFSFNGVSWSLSVEMFFYGVFPFLIWNWERTKCVKLLGTGLLAGCCIAWATISHVSFLGDDNVKSIDALVYIFPAARLFEFTIGILAAWAWGKYRHRLVGFATLMQSASIILLIFAVPFIIKISNNAASHGYISMATLKWIHGSGSAPIFAIVIYSIALSNGIVARALSLRPFVLLGEISFSLYLTHQLLMRALDLTDSLSAFGSLRNQLFVYWTMSLTMSFFLWIFIEKPCRKKILEKFDAMWPEKR